MAISGNLLPANAESIETDASAWVAVLNANTLTRSSGGTLGSFCLSFKSTAAGDTQIGLAARVDVTPNVEHWTCASVFPPAPGAQARIEIRWYTSGGTLISTTQGPTTTAPSSTWFQVGALGTAPATAATANVVIRVTATAATQSWFADRVFLGLTSTSGSTGNLLPFNTETVEIDVSGWFAATNCSIGVSTASATWYQSLLVTATAAGDVMARTALSQAPTVTPGVEYVAYAYVTAGTAGLTQKIQIYWRDAGGTELSVSSATWTPPANAWTRIVVVATAPAGAAAARVAVSPTATAAGQQWAYDRVVLAPSSALMVAGNLLPYNVSDMEQDVSGWTVTGATKSQTTEQVLAGGYAMKLVGTGGDIVASATVPMTLTAGLGYQLVMCTYKPSTRIYQTRVEWLNAAGEATRTRWQSWSGAPNMWLAGTSGDLAPDGAVAVRLSFIVPSATAGEVWYLDRAEWRLGGLTTRAVPAAGGGAAITARGLTTGGPTWKWSLERIVSGETPQPVRGWTGDLTSQSITGDVAVITDYEAPLGVPVQWRTTIKNPAGSGSFSYTSDPVTLTSETLDVWIKDPGLPARSVHATVQTLPDWQRAARQGVNQVRGRVRPIIISDVRTSRTGTLTLTTQTEEEKDELWWVLDSGNTLLLQWPPGWGEKDVYVSVGDVTEAHITESAEFSDRAWTLALTEVDRPIGGIVGSADRTWQTVADAGSSWAAALAGATSWLDVYTGVVGS
ncbi:hypothetical protein [Streptomyces sp. NPDC005907]|uniref:hypothetical protein n=1 Tax=Streptomyces sp. NPDC005907 TaxID=3154571 RepID=UPI0033E9B3DA